VTYGGSHVAAIHFMHQAVPRRASGSAQALYATVASGLAMGFATLIAGWIYARYGGGSYAAMAGISVLSLVAAWRLRTLWDGGGIFDPLPAAQKV
jgi:MFS transporter, PPP family, 3-phenylpropionic acid transporter